MASLSDIDNFIQSAGDEFTQVYQTINPPPAPAVTPVVYTTAAPAGGTAIGLDANVLILVALAVLAVWLIVRK